jgi:hypothetical protein
MMRDLAVEFDHAGGARLGFMDADCGALAASVAKTGAPMPAAGGGGGGGGGANGTRSLRPRAEGQAAAPAASLTSRFNAAWGFGRGRRR